MKFLYYFLLSLVGFASGAAQSATLYTQLRSINRCWGEQKDISALRLDRILHSTYSDQQLIQLHLQLVETTLRNRSTNGLSPAQKIARFNNLNSLHTYWQTNTYPFNNKTVKRNPVFIDDYNTFCAVGYLMKTSGHESLARTIAATQNLFYLRDIRVEGLNEWVKASGLTPDELAWIQPGYVVHKLARPLGKGVNGPVYAMAGDSITRKLYVGGSFTLADSTVISNNIVEIHYDEYDIYNNTFKTMGDGLNGPVYALLGDGDEVYAGGKFYQSGTIPVNNIAKWNGLQWNGLGQLNGTVYALCKYNDTLYAGGEFAFLYNCQTFLNIAYWDGTIWKPVCNSINGTVKALTVHENKLIVGGTFTAVKLGVDSILTNHLFAFNGQTISSLGHGVSANVRALESIDGDLFAGGDIQMDSTDTSYFGIDRYNAQNGWTINYIKDILRNYSSIIINVNSMSNHYVGGKLGAGGMGAYRGSTHTGYFQDNRLNAFATINHEGEVFSILSLGRKVFLGGQFSSVIQRMDLFGDFPTPASNLAIWDPQYNAVNNISARTNHISIYPNPSNGGTTIGSNLSISVLRVYDMSGKLIWENRLEKGTTKFEVRRDIFPAGGLYHIAIETTNGIVQNQKLLVE